LGITQDEYDKKARELKEKQFELSEKLSKLTYADKEYSITLISLLNICSRALELFGSSKVEQKRQLINCLLSNLKLRGKKLEYTSKKPFDALVDLDYRSNWLATVDKVRTALLSLNKDIFISELEY
jgi:site-specific DNA recombinase